MFTSGDAADVPASGLFAAEVAAPAGDRPKAGRLLEQEAVRMGAALDDYEHVSVTDIGGTDESGYWLCVTDHRLGLAYKIGSHADYWDFLGYFCDGKKWPVKAFPREEVA